MRDRWGKFQPCPVPPAREISDAALCQQSDRSYLQSRAIARSATLDHPGIHRRSVYCCPDNFVCSIVSICDVTWNLPLRDSFTSKRERYRRFISRLNVSSDNQWIRLSIRGQVPVLSLPTLNPSFTRDSLRPWTAKSPALPAAKFRSPT